MNWWHRFKTVKNILLVVFAILVALLFFSFGKIYPAKEIVYGATYSPKHARDLGLDWKKVFTDSNRELGITNWRLSAYWDQIESNSGQYDWSEMDWLLQQTKDDKDKVILAVGGRLPRWPECHFPDWAKNLTKESREEKILNYIALTVERYKDNPSIIAWQVENEPFLSHFGECPVLDADFLDKEIALVKKMTNNKPIVVTDSGELSLWVRAASRADIFGTTMYRNTYSSVLNSYISYPITPAFFRAKRNLANLFASPKKWIVIELQAEPWASQPYQAVSQAERDRTMNAQQFTETMEFARNAGFKELYLWGVEWWYWEKETRNRPDFWEKAKVLFASSKL